ncbi:MAG TPA: hypothetical protein PLL95_05795 [Anaerolineales bacterium]|nr:hypothetical protein [Anaerolineales bacterium]
MLRRFRVTSLVLMWLLVGCSYLPFVATPTPTALPTSTPTRTPLPTQTPSPTVTPILVTYPFKHVWFKYTVERPAEEANPLRLTEEPLLVIYTDGTMIAARTGDPKVRTRVLNTKEVCDFLNRLDTFGFYTLEDSHSTDETNPLYDFGTKYQAVDEGDFASLTVNRTDPKSVTFFEPYRKFFARPMRKIMEFVETYNPGALKAYEPDRLVVFVQRGRAEGTDEKVRVRDWTVNTFSLKDAADLPYTFLEGQVAVDVYALLAKYETHIYLENEIEYTVTMRLLFPHEVLNADSTPIAIPTEARLPVNCTP